MYRLSWKAPNGATVSNDFVSKARLIEGAKLLKAMSDSLVSMGSEGVTEITLARLLPLPWADDQDGQR